MTGLLEVARPGFLWAGLLLAGAPLLLHLIRPRERTPRPLPTARFLTSDTRTRIRVHKWPDRPLLLALRMGLCLLLGAALAGLSWVGSSEGSQEIVVVAASVPEEVLDELPSGAQVVTVQEPAGLPSLLRTLRDTAGRTVGADSLSARIVAHPRWDGWGPGTLELREDLWPGRIALEVPPSSDSPPFPEPPPERTRPTIQLDADSELEDPIRRSLELLGLTVGDASPGVHLRVGTGERLGDLWTADASDNGAPAPHFLLRDGRVIQGAGSAPPGTPGDDSTVPLLRIGGTPAAAARSYDDGSCSVALPLTGDAPVLDGGELPLLLDALLREGCPGVLPDDGAEWAWRQLLEWGPAQVEAAPLRTREAGLPLTRLLLVLALAAAVGELFLARARNPQR